MLAHRIRKRLNSAWQFFHWRAPISCQSFGKLQNRFLIIFACCLWGLSISHCDPDVYLRFIVVYLGSKILHESGKGLFIWRINICVPCRWRRKWLPEVSFCCWLLGCQVQISQRTFTDQGAGSVLSTVQASLPSVLTTPCEVGAMIICIFKDEVIGSQWWSNSSGY